MTEGIEAGEICNREGCTGIIQQKEIEGGCSCHTCAPCSYCTTAKEYCEKCGWDAKEEQDDKNYESLRIYNLAENIKNREEEWENHRKQREQFWEMFRGSDPVDKITYVSRSHTNFTMIKEGAYPPGMDLEDLLKEIRGTFGGRFKMLDRERCRFIYIAHTD